VANLTALQVGERASSAGSIPRQFRGAAAEIAEERVAPTRWPDRQQCCSRLLAYARYDPDFVGLIGPILFESSLVVYDFGNNVACRRLIVKVGATSYHFHVQSENLLEV
jgi:hypothetical protein